MKGGGQGVPPGSRFLASRGTEGGGGRDASVHRCFFWPDSLLMCLSSFLFTPLDPFSHLSASPASWFTPVAFFLFSFPLFTWSLSLLLLPSLPLTVLSGLPYSSLSYPPSSSSLCLFYLLPSFSVCFSPLVPLPARSSVCAPSLPSPSSPPLSSCSW